jgi:hypothetical protein
MCGFDGLEALGDKIRFLRYFVLSSVEKRPRPGDGRRGWRAAPTRFRQPASSSDDWGPAPLDMGSIGAFWRRAIFSPLF